MNKNIERDIQICISVPLMTMNHYLIIINVLLTEVHKYLKSYSPDLMNEVFYLLRKHSPI